MGHYFIAGSDVTPISPLDVGFAGNDGEYGKPTSDFIFGFHCTKQHAFHHFSVISHLMFGWDLPMSGVNVGVWG